MCDDLGISDEKIKVYFLKTYEYDASIGYTKEELLKYIEEDLDNLYENDDESEYLITMKIMRKSEYQNLPEIDG